jgi:hypothetical protein
MAMRKTPFTNWQLKRAAAGIGVIQHRRYRCVRNTQDNRCLGHAAESVVEEVLENLPDGAMPRLSGNDVRGGMEEGCGDKAVAPESPVPPI